MKTKHLISLVFFLTLSILTFSQIETPDTPEQLHAVTKIDGMEYIGEILSDDGREILLNTDALGKIYIPKSEIKTIVKVEDYKYVKFGEFRSTGPFTTRYSFTNNAHPVSKGENYALLNLYGPEVHFALSDNFSLGIMSTWIASPMILALKYSIPTENPNLNFSLGTLMGTSGYLNNFRGYMGLHWANVTIGNRMNNISLAAGYGYIDAGFDNMMYAPGVYYNEYPDRNLPAPITHGPMASIAGVAKVGSKVSFVFDSMIMYVMDGASSDVYEETQQSYYDTITDQYIDPQFTITVSERKGIAMMFMPGLRFQKSEKNAFQFNLSGVAYIGKNESFSFPFPMCTWFIRF